MLVKTFAWGALAVLALPTAAVAQSDATRADLECLAFYAIVDGDTPADEKDSAWNIGIGGIVGHFTTRIMARDELDQITEQSLADADASVDASFALIGDRCVREAEIFVAALNRLSS